MKQALAEKAISTDLIRAKKCVCLELLFFHRTQKKELVFVAGSDLGLEIFEVVTPRGKPASHGETREFVLICEEESCRGEQDPKTCLRNPVSEFLFPKPCLRNPVSEILSPKTCLRNPNVGNHFGFCAMVTSPRCDAEKG